jgi:hypothetical protein
MRLRAIVCAAFYAVAPYWLYEDEPHYAPMGYLAHLWMNLGYAARWVAGRETDDDRAFELEVNGPNERTNMNLLQKRPTEVLTGPPFGLAAYGFCLEVGTSKPVAASARSSARSCRRSSPSASTRSAGGAKRQRQIVAPAWQAGRSS